MSNKHVSTTEAGRRLQAMIDDTPAMDLEKCLKYHQAKLHWEFDHIVSQQLPEKEMTQAFTTITIDASNKLTLALHDGKFFKTANEAITVASTTIKDAVQSYEPLLQTVAVRKETMDFIDKTLETRGKPKDYGHSTKVYDGAVDADNIKVGVPDTKYAEQLVKNNTAFMEAIKDPDENNAIVEYHSRMESTSQVVDNAPMVVCGDVENTMNAVVRSVNPESVDFVVEAVKVVEGEVIPAIKWPIVIDSLSALADDIKNKPSSNIMNDVHIGHPNGLPTEDELRKLKEEMNNLASHTKKPTQRDLGNWYQHQRAKKIKQEKRRKANKVASKQRKKK